VKLNDPDLVRRQYRTEAGLAVRRDAVARFREGPDAVDVALLAAVAAPSPRRVLEVGCGMGQFAERLVGEIDLELVAVDLSPRMVELARERGVDARVGDAQRLAFRDAQFDCVVANWMLYHVDDLELALAEFVRVLVPGGRLVAATVGEKHMREVWELMGFLPPLRPFSRENGEETLRRYFAKVERHDVDAVLVFPDVASVHDYVESTFFSDAVPRPLPEPGVPFRSRTVNAVFIAETAA
jgi:SAM-dependent methyltransferase